MVQEETRKRTASDYRYFSNSCFSGKIICGECSLSYGKRVWHSNNKYHSEVWQCRSVNSKKCGNPHIYDEDLKKAFVDMVNKTFSNKDKVLENLEDAMYKILSKGGKKSNNKLGSVIAFFEVLREKGIIISDFDDNLWNGLVEMVAIYNNTMVYKFKDGAEFRFRNGLI